MARKKKTEKKPTETVKDITPIVTNSSHTVKVMYENWFLDYASYVILERAVPYIDDGLKPVQRRILHSMWELEDGRYNKVANLIGNTMKYHPHGDASIGDALIQIGQKDLLIDTQGNWGNIYTGDSAAASRYIEARLSKFALDVVFNPKTTKWQLSYDGRNKEPEKLPVKFPLLLDSGVEGIAVGLACKILPHNFCELIQASIDVLRKKKINLMPDFPTGGIADFTKYEEGIKGGKIKVRAVIDKADKKTLIIKEIPYGTTTSSLIDSILAANDKGKIKIKKVEDNTAAEVDIQILLHPDQAQDIDKTIEALYAFTQCEVSISPNSCVIKDNKPQFLSVNEILKDSTHHTVDLLKLELEIRLAELLDDWHFSSLEKIFIENRIYLLIEKCETWEAVISAIDKGLEPFKKKLKRKVTEEDIVRLTEIKIKRISKYDAFKADEKLKGIEQEIKEVKDNLENLIRYAIDYFKNLLKKYGKGRERKTKIEEFDSIDASQVIAINQKLYVNRAEGFAGFGLKKEEFITECSELDDVIAFTKDGKMMVSRISDKSFFGKDIIHIDLFSRKEEDKDKFTYNMIYTDGPKGAAMVKRFTIGGVTRDKSYDLTKGKENSKVLYFHIQSDTEKAEIVDVLLKPKPKLRNKVITINIEEQLVKGRGSNGNIVTKNAVQKVVKSNQKVVETIKQNEPSENSSNKTKANSDKKSSTVKKAKKTDSKKGTKENELQEIVWDYSSGKEKIKIKKTASGKKKSGKKSNQSQMELNLN
ncbi:MAG TPA: DNA gyrase/topoisomerase IV subunit A [Bacteroidia bacterium]|nr:DNA gyrase/topoisomerase IV subunit A [Bacteroidia bacterium]HNT80146.1 DNA gyrase/topoisomerase IV subunit A [Bacteroidia bacterium]